MCNIRTLEYQVKFLSRKDEIEVYHKAVNDFFSSVKWNKFDYVIKIGSVETSKNEFDYEDLQETIIEIACSNIVNDFDFANFAKNIHKMWCQESQKNIYLEWLLLDNSFVSSTALLTSGNLRLTEIALGTFPAMRDYFQSLRFRQIETSSAIYSSISCVFNHLQKEVNLYISSKHKKDCQYSGEMGYKIVFNYDSIIRIIANINPALSASELFLHLEHPPFLYADMSEEEEICEGLRRVTKVKQMEVYSKKFERVIQLGCTCNKTLWKSKKIGKNLVLKLAVEDKFQFGSNLEHLSLRCSKKTEICFANVTTHTFNKVNFGYFPYHIPGAMALSRLDKFSYDYAWNVIFSRLDVIWHQISLESMKSKSYMPNLVREISLDLKSNVSALVKTLYFVADMIDKGIIFSFLSVLRSKFIYFCNFVELNVLPTGMCYARRVVITPSRLLFLQPYEHFENRIIRKFGVEFMLRVSVQDDNFSKLTYAVQYNSKKEEIMKNIVVDNFLKGITVGCRKYEPLASSNSQLREHGMWFYAKDLDGNTAESIRHWMGDFSSIKNVAKYMARMGQCLSSTETGVQILVKNEEELKNFCDIKSRDGRYIFSDGIGIISSDLAKEVRHVMHQNKTSTIDEQNVYEPSAFQIRYKGCKGMLVEYNIPGRKLGIRPSMKKFECTTSNQLEIVKTSAPTKLYLNKHLITILEQMGVPKEEFLKLEIKMILNLLDSLTNEEAAKNSLSENLSPVFPFSSLQKAGFRLTTDPFFRSLLLAYFKFNAEKLKVNMRIPIPDQYGRNMMGVLDETKSLKYGQVFVQYSKSLTDTKAGTHILKGPVLVTKNPSLHPGDVRKLMAVDVPKLHHIKDCIVFPAEGKRPHPDEMAGSDLDGDEMVVLWYGPLIFPRKSVKPMDYPVYKEDCNNRNIQLPDMVNFFCEYIQHDNIGTFAHAHLVWADSLNEGIFSKKCMDIAKRYPYVLDFAKHGTTEHLKRGERPYHYPDFMQKGLRGNTYHSHKVLGSLYRTSRVLDACSSKINLSCETSDAWDPDLEYPGWKGYEQSAEAYREKYTARILQVLDRYSLSSEAEAFSGFIEFEAYKKWRQEKSNAVKIVKKYLVNIMGYYRNKFLSDIKEDYSNGLNEEEICERKYQRASAWYMVVYGQKRKRVLSFPWVLGDILSDMKRKKMESRYSSISNISNFLQELDIDIMEWYSSTAVKNDISTCFCYNVLQKVVLEWVSSSGLIIGNSNASACCSSCCERILSQLKIPCCNMNSSTLCSCNTNCSPAKLIVGLLQSCILNIKFSGKCNADSCDGFLPKNLQELALQTYSFIAITRNILHLGLKFNSNNFTKHAIFPNMSEIMFEEEGDPIKIPANEDLQGLINMHIDDIEKYLKRASGVRYVKLTPESSSRCLIVNSIGKNWQRWNLQEILLDSNFVANLKENLHIIDN